jgi:hypothetical protein
MSEIWTSLMPASSGKADRHGLTFALRAAFSLVIGLAITLAVAAGLSLRTLRGVPARQLVPPSGLNSAAVEQWSVTGVDRRFLGLGWGAVEGPVQRDAYARLISDRIKVAIDSGPTSHSFPAWWGNRPDTEDFQAGAYASSTFAWLGCIQDARGWPFPALSSEWRVGAIVRAAAPLGASEFGDWAEFGVIQPAIRGIELDRDKYNSGLFPLIPPTPRTQDDVRAVPTRPIWIGLLADSLLYGVVVGVAPCTRSLRRFLRTRGGLCPRCAYDLVHDLASGCPECGWNRINR